MKEIKLTEHEAKAIFDRVVLSTNEKNIPEVIEMLDIINPIYRQLTGEETRGETEPTIIISMSEYEYLIAADITAGILTNVLRTYEYNYIEKSEIKDLISYQPKCKNQETKEMLITVDKYARLIRMSVHVNLVREYYKTHKDSSLSKNTLELLMGRITLNPAKEEDEDE